MKEVITPAAGPLTGTVRLPGDKSISHRYAMLASMAEGTSIIDNYSSGADCHSTLGCLRALGVPVKVEGARVSVTGLGMRGFRAPEGALDAGNSGSTMRMLSGLLAGHRFRSQIYGDESLSRRPMQRIMGPLEEMGARIAARDGRFPPLEIEGADLRPIVYQTPVASAQVKSCVLLAGLTCEGETVVREPVRTRDHTEIALRELGAEIQVSGTEIRLKGRARLAALPLRVPGDLSAAAFFLAAGAIVPGSNLVIANAGLNPTRAALIDFLVSIGVQIEILDRRTAAGEPVGDLLVRGSEVKGGVIAGPTAAALIDEIPVLAILGALSEEGLVVKDAAELRVKETDRIRTVEETLARLGVSVAVRDDGFTVPGRQKFRAAALDSFGDHRIGMAGAVAALRASGACEIDHAEAASVSFPEFWDTLRRAAAGV